MTRKMLPLLVWVFTVFTILASLQRNVAAGPPLVCFPFEIGDARSLPWDSGRNWNTPKADYNIANLVPDTLSLLSPGVPVIVRMETLRRAVIYSEKDPRVAYELLSRLMARALNAEAGTKSDPLVWFDAGYVVETYKQARWMYQKQGGWLYTKNPAEGLNGYEWVMKSLSRAGKDPAIEFAAALMLDSRERAKEQRAHLRNATAGAADGSLLAKNLVSHFGRQGGSLADLRAQYGKSE